MLESIPRQPSLALVLAMSLASCVAPVPSLVAPSPSPASPTPGTTASLARFTAIGPPFQIGNKDEVVGMAVREGVPELWVAVTQKGESWRSTDRASWTKGGELAFDPGLIERDVRDLADSDGRFIAVGRERVHHKDPNEDFDIGGLMWTSTDGSSWDLVRLDRMEIRGLAPESDPLAAAAVAFGEPSTGAGVARLDGRTWTLDRPPGVFTTIGFGQPEDLLPVGKGFLIVGGREFYGGSGANVVVWDGDRDWLWLTNDSPIGPALEHLVYRVNGFAALGAGSTFWTATGVDRWSKPATLPFAASRLFQAPDGSLLAMGDGIWGSIDGGDWTRIDDGTAPIGSWAYAAGVAIGCGDRTCRPYASAAAPE